MDLPPGPACPHHNDFQSCYECQLDFGQLWSEDNTMEYDMFQGSNIPENSQENMQMQTENDRAADKILEDDVEECNEMLESHKGLHIQTGNYGTADRNLEDDGEERNEMLEDNVEESNETLESYKGLHIQTGNYGTADRNLEDDGEERNEMLEDNVEESNETLESYKGWQFQTEHHRAANRISEDDDERNKMFENRGGLHHSTDTKTFTVPQRHDLVFSNLIEACIFQKSIEMLGRPPRNMHIQTGNDRTADRKLEDFGEERNKMMEDVGEKRNEMLESDEGLQMQNENNRTADRILEGDEEEIPWFGSKGNDNRENAKNTMDLLKKYQVMKLRDVLDMKFLQGDPEENLSQSTMDTESQPLLSEEYFEFPHLSKVKNRRPVKATPEELQFFKYSKSILLETKSQIFADDYDFSRIQPDPEVLANVFLEFICEEKKRCTQPKIIMNFLTVIGAILSIPQLVLNDKQLSALIKFLLHCMFIDINSVQHVKFRGIVAQILTIFTNGSSLISKHLYKDIVAYFKKIIEFFPLDVFHWNAILLTIKFMGISAIQSIMIPNFSCICDLLQKSFQSLESFDEIPSEGDKDLISDKEYKERKRFNNALKIYIDASNLRAQLLKMCAVLIEDVVKEDIRTEERVIYIPKEIYDLCNEGGHVFVEPEPIRYKFQHSEFKSFFDKCFEYFGDSLMAHISSVFTKYEKSNNLKAKFFQQKYKLFPIKNTYVNKTVISGKNKKVKHKEKRNRNTPVSSWLPFLNEQYAANYKREPQHWSITGNLETYI